MIKEAMMGNDLLGYLLMVYRISIIIIYYTIKLIKARVKIIWKPKSILFHSEL